MTAIEQLSSNEKYAIEQTMNGICDMIGYMAYTNDTLDGLVTAVIVMTESGQYFSLEDVIARLNDYKENNL
jgi:hypothetical protein